MNYRKIGLTIITFASFVTFPVSSRADYLTSLLGNNPDLNELSDSSFETVLKGTGNTNDTILQNGDILLGVNSFQEFIKQTPTGNITTSLTGSGAPIEVTSIFAAQVSISGASPSFTITLTPTSLFTGTNTLNINGGSGYGTGAMAATYENTIQTFNNLSKGTIQDYLNAAQSGQLVSVVGFTGTGGAATGGEGWQASVHTLSITPTTNETNVGSYNANFDLVGTSGLFNSNPNIYQFTSTQGSFFGNSSPTEFAIANAGLDIRPSGLVAPNDGTGNPFALADNGAVTFQLTVAPEPSSIVLLSLGGFGLLGAAWRRRRALVA
jgi:hypothetical protein